MGPGHPPSRSGINPFEPPSTLSICDRNTRKNDKLSFLIIVTPSLAPKRTDSLAARTVGKKARAETNPARGWDEMQVTPKEQAEEED